MKKVGYHILAVSLGALLASASADQDKIYRVVDEDGNVTYTDQPPADGSDPMELPGLSIIATDPSAAEVPAEVESETVQSKPNLVELRKRYQHFRILQPLEEETFWGTANEVVVTWGSKEPLQEDMRVVLLVDATPTEVTGSVSKGLVLDRGEHTVQVKLYDGDNRLVVTSPKVTFYVRQASLGHLTDRPRSLVGL